MASNNNSDIKGEFEFKFDFPKYAGDYNKYMEELNNIENETGISIKIVVHAKGKPSQLELAQKRISQIKYSDKANPIKPVDFENGQNLTEEFKTHLNIIKNELNLLNLLNIVNQELQAKLETLTNKDIVDSISGVDLDKFYKSYEYLKFYKFSGDKPIHTASAMGRVDVVNKLIQSGTSVDLKNNSGWTPLHYASQNGHLNVVKYLINVNAPINAQTNFGSTALILASERGYNKSVVEYLCSKKAKVDIKQKHNRTALDVAGGHVKDEIIQILKKYGA